ncbi:MAG: SIR2 family protein [Candidatus Methylacidiphilales bacterium]|nr:SIR2 family protein [Candidatus Methylacidiphilales bacterium]
MWAEIPVTLPATLVERLRSNRVLPFIGAGVSMAVKAAGNSEPLFPSWRTLLERAAGRLDREQKPAYAGVVRNLLAIDKPDFLDAAKRAKEGLGPVWFDFLKEQFDHQREAASDETLTLARAVWTLGSNLIVTTNYDRVLRWSCAKQDDVGLWNIEAPAEQAAAIRDGLKRPVIWHLHGSIDDASNIILTPDGYDRLYPTSTTQNRFTAAQETLRTLLATHSFLFIGYSLNDHAFGLQLKAISDMFVGANGPHYALVHSSSVETVKAQRLPGIELIEFAEYGPGLESLVQTLGKESTENTHGIIVTSDHDENEASVVLLNNTTDAFEGTSDTPPPTTHWVGREEELRLLRSIDSKVVAVTGIGGQGKSTLVARYLAEVEKEGVFWDWRDCKEESNTLHT